MSFFMFPLYYISNGDERSVSNEVVGKPGQGKDLVEQKKVAIYDKEEQNESGKKEKLGGIPRPKILSPEDKVNRIIANLSVVERKIDKIHSRGIPKGFDDMRNLGDVLKAGPSLSRTNTRTLVEGCNTSSQRPKTMEYAHSSMVASLEYSKTFEFSKKLDIEERMTLAKYVTAICSNMWNAYFTLSNYQSDRLILPDGTEAGANMHGFEDYVKDSEILQRTLRLFLRNRINRIEYMLLKAIIMCNPTVSSLSSGTQAILEAERQNYAFCLLRYCQIQHGSTGGPARYAELLAMVPNMEFEVQRQKSFHAYMNTVVSTSGSQYHQLVPFVLTNLFDEVLGA